MFFDNSNDLRQVLVVGTLSYLWLVLLVRVSGKRTLGKMNAFDLIVTIALGSTLASAMLSSDVPLVEGALALGLLVALQFAVAWSSVRVGTVRRAVKSEPTALLRDGRLLQEALRRQRVTPGEVRQAVRAGGFGGLEEIDAVVLETDGSFSVIPRSKAGSGTALVDIASPGAQR